MNKKAILLKFIIWMIIALGLFIPSALFAADYFSLSSKTDSYYETIKFIEEVSAKEKTIVERKMINIPEKSALIGFSENSEKLEYLKDGKVKYSIESQEACDKKSCLCLCEGFVFKIMDEGARNEKYIAFCNKEITKCRKFDNIKFPESVYVDKGKKEMFKGGFLLNKEVVYVRNFDDKTVSVCDVITCSNVEDNQK